MISGTVTDPQSAVVVNATVLVINTGTSVPTRLVTNSSGYYEAPLLIAGDYQVTVEAPGFKKAVRSGLTLALGEQLSISFRLEIGSLTDSVTVTAESPILDTSTVATGRVLSRRDLMDLPVMTSNVTLLARLAPGVQNPGTTQYIVQGMVNGSSGYYSPGNVGGNEWSIDGAPNNGSDRRMGFTPFVDTVDEFKVETSNFDASFGHSSGLNISMSTKAGANALRGTVTEQFWNQRWNAAPFFVKQQFYRNIAAARAAGNNTLADRLASSPMMPSGHAHNYAGTVSGPVYIPKLIDGRNKLFFFLSYSGLKDLESVRSENLNYTVPTMLNRQGNFSQLLQVDPTRYQIYDPLSVRPDPARPTHYIRTPFTGNILPPARLINPIYNFYVKRVPVPNNDPTDPKLEPVNNYRATGYATKVDYSGWVNRIDYQLNDKHRFFFRWLRSQFVEENGDWTFASEPGLMSAGDNRRNLGGALDWTYSKSAATVFNVTANSNIFWQRMAYAGLTKYKPSEVGFPSSTGKYMDEKCSDHCIMPNVTWSGYQGLGMTYNSLRLNRQQSLKLNAAHIRGSHSLRGGFDVRQYYRTDPGRNGYTGGNFSFGNTYTRKDDDGAAPAGSMGLSWAAFMLGIPNGASIDTNGTYAMFNPYYAWYGQDTWRVNRALTVTLGLRLEYEGGPTERYNQVLSSFDPNAKLPIADAAVAAYAASPLTEVPVSSFVIKGGSLYAGAGGADRKLWKNELMWLPRVSAAWQLSPRMVLRGGYGIYFDTLNVMNEGANQYGYSRTTSTTISTDFGQTWNLPPGANPANGNSPLQDPFPVRADGTRFDVPFGNVLGAMAVVGRGFSFNNFDRQRPRVQRWRVGLQRQLGANMMVEASYWGQWGDRISLSQKMDALPQKYWATGLVRNDAIANDLNKNVTNPFNIKNFASLQTSDPVLYRTMSTMSFFTSSTIRKAQLLRPYPNMNGLTDNTWGVGKARTHALEITFERRFSKGFNLNASYSRMASDKWDVIENEFDPGPSRWYPTGNARPHRFTASGIYEFPFGKGRTLWQSGIPGYIAGGWQAAATYEWQPGDMLSWGNIFYNGDISTFVQEANSGTRTLDRWFNTSLSFERASAKQPANYHVRVFPLRFDGLRADTLSQWNVNLQRSFTIRERLTLQLRLDALNLQNRSQFQGPNTNPVSTDFGKVTSQTASLNRSYQIQARLQF